MRFPKIFLFLLLPLVLLSASCSLFRGGTHATPVAMPEITVTSDNPQDLYRATATKSWELAHTDIDIRFQFRERTAEGVARLMMHPYYYATDSLVLDAKSMDITGVTDQSGHQLAYRHDTALLAVHLPVTYKREDTLTLTIRYKATPYALAAGSSSAITEDRGLYFINTDGHEPYQQMQVWTQGETESNSHWFPTFDKTNFRSTFDITIHVPDSLVTLSNGRMVSSVKEKGGMRADTWKQDKPIPPYLAMMAVSNFAIAKESWNGKEVSYYVPQEYAVYAKDIFARTPEMIGFYSRLLGVAFPWDKYSQVVGYDYVSGAMENVSASLFGAFNLKDRRELEDDNNDYIVAHELFHQWFGDYVTAESWSNLTLNESFADYGEHLWSEHQYGNEARQTVWIQDLNKYLNQARYSDPPLLRFHYHNREDMFDRVSYSKGGLILHYMRQLAGDSAFFDALRLYLKQNALHSAEVPQLRLALEQVTGRDWNVFFDQWYYRGGHPVLDVSYTYSDSAQKLAVLVRQMQPDSIGLYSLPLKAQIIEGNKATETDWNITEKETRLEYPYRSGQRPVIVPDAEHWLPGAIKDNKTAAQWMAQFRYSGNRISRKLALEACQQIKNNDTARQVVLQALKDKDPYLRQLAITGENYDGNKKLSDEWINTLGQIAAQDTDRKARTAALRALGDLRREDFSTVYETAVSDSSYKVAAAGLYALDKVNHKRAVEYARNLQPERMMGNALLYQAAKTIAREGLASDYSFFEEKTLRLYERDRNSFLDAVQQYLYQVQDRAAYEKGLALLQRLSRYSPESGSGYYSGILLLNVKKFYEGKVKSATDKAEVDEARSRKDLVTPLWEAYKRSVKDENVKADIAQREKE